MHPRRAVFIFLVVAGSCSLFVWLRISHWSSWTALVVALCPALAILLPLGARKRRWVLLAGPLIFLSALGPRLASNTHGKDFQSQSLSRGDQRDQPQLSETSRWLNRLVSERDVAVAGAQVLISLGALPARDSEDFIPHLEAAYERMHASEETLASPTSSTFVGAQSTKEFDLLVFGEPSTTKAVVFLHGYAGNFMVQCWHLANASATAGFATFCPSVGFRGDWWNPQGADVLRTTLDHLADEGFETVILAGLSNGARGTAVLARRFGAWLDGIIVISGAASVAPPRRIPVLALQGTRDSMFPAAVARNYARAAGRRGQFVPFDTGHFMLLDRYEEVEPVIGEFLGTVSTDHFQGWPERPDAPEFSGIVDSR